MKKVFSILALSLLAAKGFAQPTADFLGIGIGAGIPVGNFAATNNQYYDKAGFAVPGGSFNINYVHKFDDLWGLAVTNFNASNSINGGKMTTVYGEDAVHLDNVSNASSLLVGVYIKQTGFPIYGKAQIGVGAVQTAGFTTYDPGGYTTLSQSDPAFGFAYSVGAGLFLPFSYHWAFTGSIDFVSILAKPSVTVVDNGNVYQGPNLSYGQNFINAQVGIGYMFGPRYHRARRQQPHQQQDNMRPRRYND